MIDLSIDNSIFVNSGLQEYIQEIDILFGTKNTELIGNTAFGTNFETFLWNLLPSETEIEDYVNEKLSHTYYRQYFSTSVKVELTEGNSRTIYALQISITPNNSDEPVTKTYVYQ